MRNPTASLLAFAAAAAAACSSPAAEPSASSSSPLIGGEVTYDDPEVGRVVVGGIGCTGTLIRRDVVITAAHCVNYGNSSQQGLGRNGVPQTFGTFTVTDGTDSVDYPVDAYVSYGHETGDDDIALVHLQWEVHAAFVQHIGGYDMETIGNGTPLAQYGYGCTDRGNTNVPPVKRRRSYVFGDQTTYGCPGDSGGPVFTGAHNVVLVASAYWTDTGLDIFANVLGAHDWIRDRIADWSVGTVTQPRPSFCPKDFVARKDMARYLERLKHRSEPGWQPPAPRADQREFSDVPKSSPDAGWIYALADDKVTAGCVPDGSAFCPNDFVPREQMAAFLIRVEYNDLVKQGRQDLIPIDDPADLTRFVDVTVNQDRRQFARSIARLFEDKITVGVDATHFDPLTLVPREQMATFIGRFEHPEQRGNAPAAKKKFGDITDPGTQQSFEGFIDEVTDEGIMEPCK